MKTNDSIDCCIYYSDKASWHRGRAAGEVSSYPECAAILYPSLGYSQPLSTSWYLFDHLGLLGEYYSSLRSEADAWCPKARKQLNRYVINPVIIRIADAAIPVHEKAIFILLL